MLVSAVGKWRTDSVAAPSAFESETFYSNPTILRKAACTCGGSCPACQSKSSLTVSQPNDPAEIEADQMAEKVMRMSVADAKPESNLSNASNKVHRKCDACDDEDEEVGEPVMRKEAFASAAPTPPPADTPPSIKNIISSSGQPLDPQTRNFFEPRFGTDLGHVRIHKDSAAGQSAAELNAKAYTLGRDIVFGNGEYQPESDGGKRLLAHELAHVGQQNKERIIRRMAVGSGSPPESWVSNYNARVVPPTDIQKVNDAIAMIRNIVDNAAEYEDCLRIFTEHCPGNSPTAFADTFASAILWKADRPSAFGFANVGANNIAYTQTGYDQETRGLAQTLIHELGHCCGIDEPHYTAEVSANYCLGPLHEFGLRVGFGLTSRAISAAFTYRRFFDLALGGQLQLSVGADIDLLGITQGIQLATGDMGSAGDFEFGSVNVGLRGRFNPWGGESFGGIRLAAEAGFDVGRFHIARETGPDEFEYGPGFIVQSTLGAEFYLPINPHIIQMSLDAGYRLIRPLNPEAENVHEFIFNLGFPMTF